MWKTIESRVLVDNPYMALRQDRCLLPDGTTIDDYNVVVENEVGCVFALTPARELILVEQYKHGIGQVCLELPAGMFNTKTANADPLQEARREFMEETGYDAADYLPLGKFVQNPTRMNNSIHLYAALNAFPAGEQHLDPAEAITVHLIPIEEVFSLIISGHINAVGTVAGVFMAWETLRSRGLVE